MEAKFQLKLGVRGPARVGVRVRVSGVSELLPDNLGGIIWM